MPGQGRLGDKANVPLDAHGCPACPHPAIGPAIQGSPDVNVNKRPALRVDDPGIHSACCGANTWTATQGCMTVFINGKSAHRMGDQNRHCGGMGQLVEGSPNVVVGDSGGGSASGGAASSRDVSGGSTSAGSAPGGSAPGGSTSAGSAPGGSAPGGSTSAGSASGGSASGGASSNNASSSGSSSSSAQASGAAPSDAPGDAAGPDAPSDEASAAAPAPQAPPEVWIEIRLVGEDGSPIAGERYVITPPDGVDRTGFTDADGCARVDGLREGDCGVSFPDLDTEAWSRT
jgi:uncharacterized Zn-binding protein involved in type VI secretion